MKKIRAILLLAVITLSPRRRSESSNCNYYLLRFPRLLCSLQRLLTTTRLVEHKGRDPIRFAPSFF